MTAAQVSVVTEALPGSQVGLTIEVPPEQVERAFDRALNRLSQRVRIEGFRPGRAPRPLIEARLGPGAIRDEVVDAMVPPLLSQAMRDHRIEAIDRPQVEVQELERGRAARFVARVSVMPEVALPDLDALHVERARTEVDDEMLERRLRELRERLAQVEPVEREVRVGDVVVGDLRVLVRDGDEEREVPDEARTATEIEVAEGSVIPELLAALPGRGVGEVAAAEVAFPEDHPDPALKGRPGRLEVTVQGVKEKLVPELTDQVAEELSGGEQPTAEALRTAVRADLEAQARRLDELTFEQAAVKAVVDGARVELPQSLVDREVDRRLEDVDRGLQQRGLRLDRYLQYLNKTESEYRAELRPDAEGRIRVDLVLEELGRQLAVAPSDDEVGEYMSSELEKDEELRSGKERMLRDAVARDYFRHRLTRLKVLESLVARLGAASATAGVGQAGGAEAE